MITRFNLLSGWFFLLIKGLDVKIGGARFNGELIRGGGGKSGFGMDSPGCLVLSSDESQLVCGDESLVSLAALSPELLLRLTDDPVLPCGGEYLRPPKLKRLGSCESCLVLGL